jgi:hypothetical protein
MRLSEGDVVCGVAATMARNAAREVDAAQWCSAGALARHLGIDTAASRSLLEALEAEGYLDKPYPGPLPQSHVGEWLPSEESSDQPLLLWHLSCLKGKRLAKARVGPPVPRVVAEALVRDVLARVGEVNRDPGATHVITRVVLHGSMTDPGQLLVSDVDLAMWADRRADAALLARWRELGPQLARDARHAEEAQAKVDRFRLEALLAADDERIDVSVIDRWSDAISAVPAGAPEIELFPRPREGGPLGRRGPIGVGPARRPDDS